MQLAQVDDRWGLDPSGHPAYAEYNWRWAPVTAVLRLYNSSYIASIKTGKQNVEG